jgi:WD40 repeat protein
VRVWDALNGKETLTLKGRHNAFYCTCFSPDSQRVAGAEVLGTVRVWDAGTGKELLTLTGHTDTVWGVNFSPDGRRLASASGDLTDPARPEVKLWDATTGQQLLTLRGGTESRLNCVCFSPDGQLLATASEFLGNSDAAGVSVWDARAGEEAVTLKGHMDRVTSVGFSSDGRRVVAAAGASVKSWDIATGVAVEPCADPPPKDQRLAHSLDGRLTAWINGYRLQVIRNEEWARRQQTDAELGLEWHLRQAAENERAGEWFAAAFHLNQLLKADPDNADHLKRLVGARVEQWVQSVRQAIRRLTGA